MSKTTLTVDETFEVKTNDSSMSFSATGDLRLANPARNSQGRALVPESGGLVINFGKDFGLVTIEGPVSLPGLGAPPEGVTTDRVLIGSDGKLYKAD